MGKILPPKTGERTIDLPTAPMEELTKLKEKSESEWVFVSSSGSHWGDCSYINRRHFQPLLKKIGIKYKSFYSLRHCYATYSLVGGQPLPYVSKQLGHKDSRTTLQSYLKYSEDIGGIEKTDKILKF
jgi:integrase